MKKLLPKIKIGKFPFHENFTCDICTRELFGSERVCSSCRALLPWNRGEICICCGRREAQTGLCIECKAHKPDFDIARSAFVYEGEAMNLIFRFKDGEKFLAETFAQFLFPLLEDYADADAICYVPMTEKSEKTRGYNQSKLLAEELSKASGLEIVNVRKTRETPPQKSLGFRERMENLKGCFKIEDKKSVRGKKIVLIDDIMTTGATASELARCLKRAGAERVYVLTAASVPNKQ